MDNSSSARKDIIDPAEEESGWTDYLQDLSFSNGSFVSSPSLVSDAAWNGSDSIARLNLNKLKRINRPKCSSYDDDLEDTASSPVNSPKVSTLKQMEVNYKRIDDVAASGNFLEKQAVSNNFWKHDREERNEESVVNIKNIDQYAELKKRGLCLVPMSTLINYLG